MRHFHQKRKTGEATQPSGDRQQGELPRSDTPPGPDGLDMVEGVVDRIVYESAETGFFVARLHDTKSRELVTFVGNLAACRR